jgi:arsenate reductase
MKTVIFACVQNAGRSQMAAAFFTVLADGGRAAALSAGTEPGHSVHPEVVEAMREVGIELSGQRPRLLTEEMLAQATHLITMGCGDACPIAPRTVLRDDWPLADPKGRDVAQVRAIRDDIHERVRDLIGALDCAR